MRQFSLLLLLIPAVLLGCDGVVIDLGSQPQEPQVAPEPKPEPDSDGKPASIEVLVFTAKWCSACQRDKPQIDEMRRRGVKVTEINVDQHPDLVRKHGIKSLPTYIVLKDGVEVERTGDIVLVVTIVSAILKIVINLLF